MSARKPSEAKKTKLDVVQIDGLALLKIIKHCDEHKSQVVTGQLLGLNMNGKLEITNSFPGLSVDEKNDQDGFQESMMKHLRKVNVDNNSVGWYQSAFMGEWIDDNIIREQASYQNAIPESIVLVYDPYCTKKGTLALKAYRLTSDFLEFYKGKDFSHINFAKHGIDSSSIFEEIPMKVHNSHLVHAFLYELQEKKMFGCEFDRLDLSGDGILKRNLDIMSSSIDDLTQDHSKFQFHQKQVHRVLQQKQARKQKMEAQKTDGTGEKKEGTSKKLPYLHRTDAFLVAAKVSHYSQKLKSMIGQSMTKMFEVDALHREMA